MLLGRLGVRGRLLLAFFGISAFAVIAAAAAMYSFAEVGGVLGRITEQRVPAALASLKLSRQAERLVTAAPALLAVTSRSQQEEVSASIAAEVGRLDGLLEDLRGSAIDAAALAAIEPLVDGLRGNLDALDDLIAGRLAVGERKERLLRRLSGANIATQRLVAPGILVMDSKVAQWRRATADPAPDGGARGAATAELADAITSFMPQKAQIELSSTNDTLVRAAAAESPADLPLLAFPLQRSLEALEALAGELDSKLRPRLLERVEELRGLAEGPASIPEARADELDIIGRAEGLLGENAELSRRLTEAVDRLVDGADRDITDANREALSVQSFSSGVLIAVVALSLVSSVLIVWLYVGRNLIARLTALSDSMLAIAGGHLRAPLPPAGDDDEIGRMAEALAVFRDTAVEVEEQNLREVAEARQRLIDAIESISEGFALYNADDRLVLCNSRYRELLYPGMPEPIEVGTPFEMVVRNAAAGGLISGADGDAEAYVRERVARHRDPGEPFLQRRADGRWILISERWTAAGGTVAVYSDLTELKRREIELNELAERQRQAAEEIARKNRELEALSTKLAKYLSPQVYASIFAGRQEVKLASQRKKLSVLFCDIVGFTETTERLESEDLTQLLNQYLTEMSRPALDHGATIDKYIGDAIMLFFGDPESRGVREDALACVRTALAMRSRMRELEGVWRDAGMEAPPQCRIGISTGYCTVGNFGSEDRMDYTIVGAGVNLAARLEQAAPPGGILISYETYALVKDTVCCRERGRIQAKGIAHPVAAYEVLDLYENLDDGHRLVREELPNVRIDLDLAAMSEDERREAAASLRRALDRLAAFDPPPPRSAVSQAGEGEGRPRAAAE